VKYYAVTDDPNELMHYGRLGMKWGQHIFSGTKSLAYKRAANKLSRRMRNGIASKVSHWRKQPTAAELRAKAKAKAAKQEARAYRKEQRFMNKAVQRAREGRLRYGKLTDDQVRRVTERLALERNARQLGSTEKPKFRTRMKEALQEGMLQGATRGGAAYIEERWRAKGKYAAQKKYGEKIAKSEARAQIKKNKAIDRAEYKAERKNAWRDAKLEQDREFYKQKAESGERRSVAELGRNPIAARVRRQHLAEQRKLESENKERKDMLAKARERYVLGDKGESKDAVKRFESLYAPKKKAGATKKLPGVKIRLKDLKKDNGESARSRTNNWQAEQNAASYRLMVGSNITPGKNSRRKVSNRPYVRVRRNRENPFKG